MADIEIYICPRCISDTRQTICKYIKIAIRPISKNGLKPIFFLFKDKKRKNFHRHDYSDGNAAKKPTQAGTPAFCEHLLNKRKFLEYKIHLIIWEFSRAEYNVNY